MTDGERAAPGPTEGSRSRAPTAISRLARTTRLVLFAATGLAVPFHAFPPFVVGERSVDAATILAVLFVLSTPPRRLARRLAAWPWLLAFAIVPLFALLSAEVPPFSHRQFSLSWGHWILVTGFFVSALDLDLDARWRDRLLLSQVVLATLVALFALYQAAAFSMGRDWPLSGTVLCPLQREPLRLSAYVAGFVRPTSVFLEPAWLAGYLAWALACAGALAAGVAGARRAALAAAAATMVAAVVATVSPGGYLDLVAGVVVLGLAVAKLGGRRTAARGLGLVLGASLAVVATGLLTPVGRPVRAAIAARANQLARTALFAHDGEGRGQDRSAAQRLVNVRDSARLLARRPMNGIGLGQFSAFQQAVHGRSPGERDPWMGWLGIAAETGLFGPVLLALPLALVVSRLRGAPPEARLLAPALVAVLAVQPFHGAYYIDLAWWFPAALAVVVAGVRPAGNGPAPLEPAAPAPPLLARLVRLYTFHTPLRKGRHRLADLALSRWSPPPEFEVRTRYGDRLVVDPRSTMWRYTYFHGEYEPTLSRLSARVVRRGDVCLDVGANVGWYTLLLRRLVGPSGAVHAFEPNPPAFACLSANVGRAGAPPNVGLHAYGLGPEESAGLLHVFHGIADGHTSLSDQGRHGFATTACRVRRLDDVLAGEGIGEVSFVKLDVEGAELGVLKGATRLFAQPVPPVLLVEMARATTRSFGYGPGDLVDVLRAAAGYRFFAVDEVEGRLAEIRGFAPEDPGANVLCVPLAREDLLRSLRDGGRA